MKQWIIPHRVIAILPPCHCERSAAIHTLAYSQFYHLVIARFHKWERGNPYSCILAIPPPRPCEDCKGEASVVNATDPHPQIHNPVFLRFYHLVIASEAWQSILLHTCDSPTASLRKYVAFVACICVSKFTRFSANSQSRILAILPPCHCERSAAIYNLAYLYFTIVPLPKPQRIHTTRKPR